LKWNRRSKGEKRKDMEGEKTGDEEGKIDRIKIFLIIKRKLYVK